MAMVLKDGFLCEIANAAGFVPSRDFIDSLFSFGYEFLRAVGVQLLSDLFCHVISKTAMVLKDGFLYEIAKAAGFVTSRDFADSRFNSITRFHVQ